MILLDTSHGFISHRFIIRIKSNEKGVWSVFYQSGSDTSCAYADETEVADFMAKVGAQIG